MANSFFWYDLLTTDTDAAAAFYGDVVGWKTQDASQVGKPYTLFTVDGVAVAGLMPFPAEVKETHPVWMGYVGVEDVDASATAIEKAGGTIHRAPTTVPGIIRFAVVADPQGAVFLVAKGLSAQPIPALAYGTPGAIGWRELYAGEWQAAFAFYESLFGWTKAEAFEMGAMGTYQLFATGAEPVGGMMTKPPVMPMPFWGYYFNVDAIDPAAARVTKAGGKILMGPTEVPGPMWVVQCMDPQGAHFALVAPKR
jgi:predicted enzyme related to lactoylglutathione lyase